MPGRRRAPMLLPAALAAGGLWLMGFSFLSPPARLLRPSGRRSNPMIGDAARKRSYRGFLSVACGATSARAKFANFSNVKILKDVGPALPEVADFSCPITVLPLDDPVTAEDGYTYERGAITQWLDSRGTSPRTKQPMGMQLEPNNELQQATQNFFGLVRGQKQRDPEKRDRRLLHWPPHGRQQGERCLNTSDVLKAVERGEVDDLVDMSSVLSRVFLHLDPIRDLLQSTLQGLTPPKIVVIGDESVGKSTLLEQLAMLPIFPRKRVKCTRMAIHLRLRRSTSQVSVARLSVERVGNLSRGETAIEEVGEISPQIIPIENAFEYVQESMDALITKYGVDGFISDWILVLEVQHPHVPSIDLVDMPGLKTSPLEEAAKTQRILDLQLEQDVRTGGHSIFLAVVGADRRPNTEATMGFIQQRGLSNRTFGVLTMCDRIPVESHDTLRAYVIGSGVEDGSAEDVGYVALGNGWVATMLKPPPQPACAKSGYYDHHNIERLYVQKQAETEFFSGVGSSRILQDLHSRGKAGTGAVVTILAREYNSYLQREWAPSTLRKLSRALNAKVFERDMVGIGASSEQAVVEVEKRWGPGTLVEDVYDRLMENVVEKKFRQVLRRRLQKAGEGETISSRNLPFHLKKLQGCATEVVNDAMVEIRESWIPELETLLTAEITADEVRRRVRERPFVQLRWYPQYTSTIMKECEEDLQAAIKDIKEKVHSIAQRAIEPGSKWINFEPKEKCSAVTVRLSSEQFIGSLVAVLQQRLPSPATIAQLHHGVELGPEDPQAVLKQKAIDEDIAKIERARKGIQDAFSISDEEMRSRDDAETDDEDHNDAHSAQETGKSDQERLQDAARDLSLKALAAAEAATRFFQD